MFVDNEHDDRRYHGYNPEFARRVREKRRRREAAELRVKVESDRLREQAEMKAAREEYVRVLEQRNEETIREREERIKNASELCNLSTMTGRQIAAYVGAQYGVTFDEIVSASRTRRVTLARQIAMATIRARKPDLSLPQIGKIFNKDHTTVLAALRRTERSNQVAWLSDVDPARLSPLENA